MHDFFPQNLLKFLLILRTYFVIWADGFLVIYEISGILRIFMRKSTNKSTDLPNYRIIANGLYDEHVEHGCAPIMIGFTSMFRYICPSKMTCHYTTLTN